MSYKIYVGGLPYDVNGEELSAMFAPHGAVESAQVVTDKYTGQSRGFGFVEMASQADGQKAISALNSTQLKGRTLTVNEAQPPKKRDHKGYGGGQRRNRY